MCCTVYSSLKGDVKMKEMALTKEELLKELRELRKQVTITINVLHENYNKEHFVQVAWGKDIGQTCIIAHVNDGFLVFELVDYIRESEPFIFINGENIESHLIKGMVEWMKTSDTFPQENEEKVQFILEKLKLQVVLCL